MSDVFEHLRRTLGEEGKPTSDYELNPGVFVPDKPTRPAGVLIAIEMRGGEPFVWLTKRSSALKHHPGQIAFPGGKVDPVDRDATDAALREAEEEIGLPRDNVEVLGFLPEHDTVTNFRVRPVVAKVLAPFTPIAEPGEVAEVFAVPLSHLAEPSNYMKEGRRWRGTRRLYYVVPYGPYYIWGATARMLRVLADRVAP
ncbi:DNA mismatch repair protein MutT [Oceanicola sp. 22II-s10i]|uniref:CoA pyrophosphatase n=1 Tax=Oceanicola sp. 22II-s10i TaxID=1317116 RepID=UPI000B5218B4|nr:CoA pyrophosphatase [Oceanicola sp. 22II-s10i]OWU86000.1 DNA mismatch repair protein MutT [Oceanicola sp. 22II-s10i]